MTVRHPTWSMVSWYLLEPADTEHPCSTAMLVLSWLLLFPSSVLLPPGTLSSSLCTPPADLSSDPKLLWELPGIFPGILWESGREKCLFQRAEKPEGSVPPFSCYTELGSTRHNFASGLSFCSVRIKLQQLYSIEINVRHSKAALTFGIWAGTPRFTWGKHWAASSFALCLLHNKQTRAYLAFSSLGGRHLSPDAAPVAKH